MCCNVYVSLCDVCVTRGASGVRQPVVRGSGSPGGQPVHNGVAVLPRSSSVARSNSLRQHSPPLRLRAAQRGRPAQGPLSEEAEREEAPPPGQPRPPPPGHAPAADGQVSWGAGKEERDRAGAGELGHREGGKGPRGGQVS